MMKKEKIRKIKTGSMIAALVTAFSVFGCMLYVEKKTLEDYEKKTVLVTSRQTEAGEDVTEAGYVAVQIDADLCPEHAICDHDMIGDVVFSHDMGKGSIITTDDVKERSQAVRDFDEPVIAGLRAEDISQAGCGVLREGDRISIYREDPDTGKIYLEWDELYVAGAYDSSGSDLDGRDGSASRLNIYIDKKDVERFYEGVSSKTLRIVRMVDR